MGKCPKLVCGLFPCWCLFKSWVSNTSSRNVLCQEIWTWLKHCSQRDIFFFSLCESKIPNTYFNLLLPEDPDIYMYHSHISSSDINPLYYVRIFQDILYYLWGINSSPSQFAWVLLHYRGDRLANVNPAALVTKPNFAARIKNVIMSVTTTTWQSLVDINTAAPSIKESPIISELQLHLLSAFTFLVNLRKRNIWPCWLGGATYTHLVSAVQRLLAKTRTIRARDADSSRLLHI